MSTFKLAVLAATFACISSVSAHGMVSGIVAGGVHPGFTVNYAYSPSHPDMPSWSAMENKDNGFINPGNFNNPDVICHKGATPGELHASVAAGSTVELQWTEWPESHHGPVIDYLANCNGECTTVDKTALKFNKIDEAGLNSWVSQPGQWASDDLIAANNSWTVTIPKNVAPGNYVLRHEIIALHSANLADGAQNYPQCINLKVTGAGTDELASGTPGMELYTPEDAGILVNIYEKMTAYEIPGPKLYDGASPSEQPSTVIASSGIPTATGVTSPEETSSDSTTVDGSSSPQETAASSVSSSSATPPYPTGMSNSTSPITTPKKPKNKKPCSTTSSSTPTPTGSSTTMPSTPSNEETPAMPSTETETGAETETETETQPENETEGREEPAPTPSESELKDMTTNQLFTYLESIIAELKSRLGSKKMRRHGRDFFGLTATTIPFDPNCTKFPSRKDVPKRADAPEGAAWVWGEDDQLGRINLLTPTRVKAATSEIKTGETIALNLPMNVPEIPCFHRETFKHEIKALAPGKAYDDVYTLNTQSGTQWDGFRHVSHLATGTFYNNTHEADIVGPDANLKDSIHHWSEHGGLVGRGILLDYRAYADKKGLQYNSFIDHRIPYEELRLCGQDQGIDIRPEAQGGHIKIGDILFIRSGFVNQYHQTKSEDWKPISLRPHEIGQNDQQKWAGVKQEESMLDWLHDCYFAAVGGDSPSFEAWPSDREYYLHEYLLAMWGCPIGEMLDLEKLAKRCHELNRWTFFVTSSPNNTPGGVSTHANAIAML
ncbi:MAG: hypothetical protein Q9169_004996 [Polycauliona sp. 2 TL-2023]